LIVVYLALTQIQLVAVLTRSIAMHAHVEAVAVGSAASQLPQTLRVVFDKEAYGIALRGLQLENGLLESRASHVQSVQFQYSIA
jgi:hypothetical protein